MKERTEAQKAASRANGAKSRGPRTEQGKNASSQNARKHGAYAKLDCTLYENTDEYVERLEAYILNLQPANEFEHSLVRAIATAELEYERYTADIAALRDSATQTHQAELTRNWKSFDLIGLQTLAFLKAGPEYHRLFEVLGRAQSRARRNSVQARKQLVGAQAHRVKQDKESQAPPHSARTQTGHQRPPADPIEALNDFLLQHAPPSEKRYLRHVLSSDHYRAPSPETPSGTQQQHTPRKEAA